MLNATYDDDAGVITRHGALHLGMATQTPNGLMVPVIRDAQSKSVWQLASEALRLAEAARTGKAAREELSGSTITLSSLGPMGGITSTPVINRPEVAIIAVNKVEEKVVVIDGEHRSPQADEPVAQLRPPRRRRLGRGQLHAGAQGLYREPAAAAVGLSYCSGAGVEPEQVQPAIFHSPGLPGDEGHAAGRSPSSGSFWVKR